ncbi:MAG: ChaN family lipoprotein [Planctomycetes bacterium]|nr:ChaN family lipoprotein [Planctomycetota bacterium]
MRHAWIGLLIGVAGCGTAAVSRGPEMPDHALAEAATGAQADFPEMIRDLAGKKVVYVGESHDNDWHHAFQYQVVRALHARDPRLMIGMEMFQRPCQEHLDRFVAGTISEEEMLAKTEYFTRWKWDWRYYRPIVLFAREHGLPIIALNAPGEVNRKVARGGLESLTPDERKWIAKEIDTSIEAHRKYVEEVFNSHPMGGMMKFENFYASQCLWEDTMAESVATALAARPGFRMAVIVGSGHVRHRFGIPVRADRRGAAPSSVLVGMDVEPDLGDWLFYTLPSPDSPPSPKLGVSLAMGPEKGEGEGLLVKEVTTGGAAAAAGVLAGDRITGISGKPVQSMEDLQIRLALLDGNAGTVEVLRGAERRSLPFSAVKVAP